MSAATGAREAAGPVLELLVRRGPLAAPVIVGGVTTFAARADLSVDRIGDIADVLEALVESLPGERIAVDATLARDGGELRIAVRDLAPGAARSVLSDVRHGGLARLLAVTADGVAVRASSTSGEAMIVSFSAKR